MKTFLARIDERIEAKSKDPNYEGAISGHYIKEQAKGLWKMIKGTDTIDLGDTRYKKYLLNVFTSKFPENPLLNSNVKCVMKPIVQYVHRNLIGFGNAQSKSAFDITKDRECRPECDHEYIDDEQLKKCYNMQNWFLNFYKYICVIVLDKEMKDIDPEDEEYAKENKDILEAKA